MTRAEARQNRRAIDRQIAIDLKAKARAKLRELRAQIRAVKASKKGKIAAVRSACKSTRRLVRVRAVERRRRLLEELATTVRLEKAAARARCHANKSHAKKTIADAEQKTRAALHEERKYQADLARIERNNRALRSTVVRATKKERASESADAVLANLPPELVPLWKRVGGSIRGSSRQSRTEAFLHYAEAHPREVLAAQEDNVDQVIAELEARANRVEHHVRRPTRRPYTAAELAAVPFDRRVRGVRRGRRGQHDAADPPRHPLPDVRAASDDAGGARRRRRRGDCRRRRGRRHDWRHDSDRLGAAAGHGALAAAGAELGTRTGGGGGAALGGCALASRFSRSSKNVDSFSPLK